SARAHASDDNSGKSFRINIDLGCGPSPAYGPLHGTCSVLCFCCAGDGEGHARPTKHEKAAGITRAAFLVSRSVALTTVVPTEPLFRVGCKQPPHKFGALSNNGLKWAICSVRSEGRSVGCSGRPLDAFSSRRKRPAWSLARGAGRAWC